MVRVKKIREVIETIVDWSLIPASLLLGVVIGRWLMGTTDLIQAAVIAAALLTVIYMSHRVRKRRAEKAATQE